MYSLKIITSFIFFNLLFTFCYSQGFIDFSLKDLNDNKVVLSEQLNNGPVILIFMATWCNPPCTNLLQNFNNNELLNKKAIKIFPIIYQKEKKDKILKYIQNNNFNYDFLIDGLDTCIDIYDKYYERITDNTGGDIPLIFLINKEKQILFEILGDIFYEGTGDNAKRLKAGKEKLFLIIENLLDSN